MKKRSEFANSVSLLFHFRRFHADSSPQGPANAAAPAGLCPPRMRSGFIFRQNSCIFVVNAPRIPDIPRSRTPLLPAHYPQLPPRHRTVSGVAGVDEASFDPSQLRTEDIREWILYRTEKSHIGPASMNREVSSLRALWHYLRRQGIVTQDIFRSVRSLRTPRRLPVFVPESRHGLRDRRHQRTRRQRRFRHRARRADRGHVLRLRNPPSAD